MLRSILFTERTGWSDRRK